jgi:hypothetical protein
MQFDLSEFHSTLSDSESQELGFSTNSQLAEKHSQREPSDSFLLVEVVENPERDFASKFLELLKRLSNADTLGAQGILVLPKGTPEYLYAENICTAAQHGVMTQVSQDIDIKRGARQLLKKLMAARQDFDSVAQSFSASMQARKKQLLGSDNE